MDDKIILSIAKTTIENSFDYENTLDIKSLTNEYPYLKEDGATFVTLKLDGNLRGCIGSLIATRPLIEDIISNAYAAAFKDPRFPKLSKEEFQNISIEVSVLTPPLIVEYSNLDDLKEKVVPFVDGIILSLGSHQATFLPQVWKELPDFDSFFARLLQKANLPLDSFKLHPKVYKYQVKKFK